MMREGGVRRNPDGPAGDCGAASAGLPQVDDLQGLIGIRARSDTARI
jgi:hypothetical protein